MEPWMLLLIVPPWCGVAAVVLGELFGWGETPAPVKKEEIKVSYEDDKRCRERTKVALDRAMEEFKRDYRTWFKRGLNGANAGFVTYLNFSPGMSLGWSDGRDYRITNPTIDPLTLSEEAWSDLVKRRYARAAAKDAMRAEDV
jgi:hypothetical protein